MWPDKGRAAEAFHSDVGKAFHRRFEREIGKRLAWWARLRADLAMLERC